MSGKNKFKHFSYSSSKWVIKLWRQLATSTTHLAQELLMNVQFSGGSRNFAKETRALKVRNTLLSHQKLTMTNWEHHWSWCSYIYTRSCPRTQCWSFYGHLAFEGNWKGEKDQKVGASWADCKSKKLSFWSVIFSYSTQQWTISRSDCDVRPKMDFIQNPAIISSMVGLRRSSKALPSQTWTNKKDYGHCLVVCCPPDPLQLSESQWNYYIWEICSENWWDAPKTVTPAAGTGPQKGSNSSPWHVCSCTSSAIFIWALINWLPFLQASWQLFCR